MRKIGGNEDTIFVYDAAGRLAAEYQIIEAAQDDDPPRVSYLTNDHLGSPRIVTDANGAVVSRKDFAAFGDETITSDRTPALGYPVTGPDIRQDFTGYQKDSESGLEFAQARYYNSQHGRFATVDPLNESGHTANPQSFNRYSYVSNDPLNLVDPTGMASCSAEFSYSQCGGSGGFWGGGTGFGDDVAYHNREYAGMPQNMADGLGNHYERMNHSEDTVATFDIIYDDYPEDDPQSANPRFGSGSVDIYQFLPRINQITNILRDVTAPVIEMVNPWHSTLTNRISQGLWGTNLINTESSTFNDADTVVAIAGVVMPGPMGKAKAANALLKHRKLIKAIVKNASKPGVTLSDAKIKQLRRVVTKAGGSLRTEVGKIGTVKGKRHSQVEGFGSKVQHRHIIHANQK